MNLKKWITSIALATTIVSWNADASEKFYPEKIDVYDPRIIKLCEDLDNRTQIILDGKEICEYSKDNGISWIKIVWWASILLWAGILFRFRKKKSNITQNDELWSEILSFPEDDLVDELWDNNSIENLEVSNFNNNNEQLLENDFKINILQEVSIWMEYGRYDDAIRIIEKQLKIEPKNLDLYTKLLEIYYITWNKVKFHETFIRDDCLHFSNSIPFDDLTNLKVWWRKIDPENPIYC